MSDYLEMIPDLVSKDMLLSPRELRHACEEGMKPLVMRFFDGLELDKLAYLEQALLQVGGPESLSRWDVDAEPALQFFTRAGTPWRFL